MKHRWFFDLLIIAVIVNFCVSALISLLEARLEPALNIAAAKAELTSPLTGEALPLQAYSVIAERNLFGGSSEETQSHDKEALLEEIPQAEESLGLRLVGTVVREQSEQNLAIIQDQKARKQEIVYEGDGFNEVSIKRVFRHKVILTTEKGDELLTMKFRSRPRTRGAPRAGKGHRLPFARRTRGRISLDREEIESSLRTMAQGKRRVRMRPYLNKGRQAGVRFSNIRAGSLFAKMGLLNGDIIKGVNNIPVTSTEDIAELYRYLEVGGEIDLEIKRRGRNRRLQVSIR